jgi:hypothetical protein
VKLPVVPSPARENPLFSFSSFIANKKYSSTVSDKLVVTMNMSLPIALSGPLSEKEVMEREEEAKAEGITGKIQINSTPLSILTTTTGGERGGSDLKGGRGRRSVLNSTPC